MYLHNKSKRLEEMESLPYEILNESQRQEIEILREIKKRFDDRDAELAEKYGGSNFVTYYNKEGTRMSFWDWSNYMEDPTYKILAQDQIRNFFISTVWLGMDHRFSFRNEDQGKPPVIFETMIFDTTSDKEEKLTSELHEYQQRYCTIQQALEGHEEACNLVMEQVRSSMKSTWWDISDEN